VLTVLSFVVGLPWGILGVSASYATMYLLLAYPAFAIPFRLIGLRVGTLGGVLWRPAVCSLVMYAAVSGLALWVPAYAPRWLVLLVLVPLGALVYIVLSWRYNRALLLEARSVLRQKA